MPAPSAIDFLYQSRQCDARRGKVAADPFAGTRPRRRRRVVMQTVRSGLFFGSFFAASGCRHFAAAARAGFGFTRQANGTMVIAVSMTCPRCGRPVEDQARFCPECSARIKPPTFWQRVLRQFQTSPSPGRPLISIKKTVSITTDRDGERREYHSLDEVPPELRREIEKLESEAVKQSLSSSSPDGLTATIINRKTVTLFKTRDAAGNEKVYHSIEEMPPQIRAALEEAQKRLKK